MADGDASKLGSCVRSWWDRSPQDFKLKVLKKVCAGLNGLVDPMVCLAAAMRTVGAAYILMR